MNHARHGAFQVVRQNLPESLRESHSKCRTFSQIVFHYLIDWFGIAQQRGNIILHQK